MPTLRDSFFKNLAQTSPSPLALHFVSAEGCELTDADEKKYLDLISGIAVSNLGHGNLKIKEAIKTQTDQFLHLMVYGEFIESPQVLLAQKLSKILPASLSCSYFTNSGAEAIEAALKLVRRYSGRTEIAVFRNAYHGSTTGALALCGNEELKNSFRPLLPGTRILPFNSVSALGEITSQIAAVFAEPVQGEAGIIMPDPGFLQALRKRCSETGTLLVFDESQTAMGRTGKMFGFEHWNVIPDMLVLSKAFGGGMPLGALVSSEQILSSFTSNPVLGHITTFGGHPVSCAAALASLNALHENSLMEAVSLKEKLFRDKLQHPLIREVRGKGLFLCLQFESEDLCRNILTRCIENGVIADWFLFAPDCIRLAPPLIISEKEIVKACGIILESINQILK